LKTVYIDDSAKVLEWDIAVFNSPRGAATSSQNSHRTCGPDRPYSAERKSIYPIPRLLLLRTCFGPSKSSRHESAWTLLFLVMLLPFDWVLQRTARLDIDVW